MQKRRTEKAVIIYICLAAFLILCIRNFEQLVGWAANLWNVMFPLVLGMIMAYVLNIVLVRVERLYFPRSRSRIVAKTRRGVGIVISILLVFALFTLIARLVFLEQVSAWLEANGAFNISDYLNLETIDWKDLMDKALSVVRSGIGSVLSSTISVVGSVVGGVVNFFIGLIFGIYILAGKERLAAQAKNILRAYLKEDTVKEICRVLVTANETFSSFIIGQCTEAVILGTLCTIGMLIFRFPYAPMIGAFIGVTALIPIVGAYIGAAVGAFMILTVAPLKALLFIVFIIVLQQMEGNLIYPKVVGSSIGLPGMWVLAAVTVGGGLLGIGGMLLGVPLAATFYKLLRDDVKEKNERKDSRERQGTSGRMPSGNRERAGTQKGYAGRRGRGPGREGHPGKTEEKKTEKGRQE